jgi:hypothetical protein
MSLHYLAMSEENLRRERLSERARREAARVLSAMREAHRKGEPTQVIEKANRLLTLDKESLEARWYRRNAEARLRAVSVGGSPRERASFGSSPEGPRSFGYAPASMAKGSRFSPAKKGAVDLEPLPPSLESSSGKGIWLLGGVGALFLGLIVVWLSSYGVAKPRVEAKPMTIPGVRTSPFDGIDEDGTVVLQVTPPGPAFAIRQVIPTSIVAGSPAKVGLFGDGLSEGLTVTADGAAVLSTSLQNEGLLEIEVLAEEPGEIDIEVKSPQGRQETVRIQVEPP